MPVHGSTLKNLAQGDSFVRRQYYLSLCGSRCTSASYGLSLLRI